MSCEHKNIIPAPPGKHLRICTDCCKRLIECDHCSETMTAGPHVVDSGWMRCGGIDDRGDSWRQSYCPSCWAGRRG